LIMRVAFWSYLTAIAAGLACRYYRPAPPIGVMMRKVLRENGFAIFFGIIFLSALLGQALTGVAQYNNQQITAGLQEITFGQYVTSSSFAVDVAENWQSEYLEFFLYIFATVWLLQKGSPESKPLGNQGTESDEEQKVGEHADPESPDWARTRGIRLALFSRSLGLVMGLIFAASWLAQSIAGRSAFNEEQLCNLQDPDTYLQYVVSSDFWNRTLQNWQSEFLAVGSMVVLSIYLRQRGSPESKPVGAPTTGLEG
jgi:fluoride ion exporter CrcB/FEX